MKKAGLNLDADLYVTSIPMQIKPKNKANSNKNSLKMHWKARVDISMRRLVINESPIHFGFWPSKLSFIT